MAKALKLMPPKSATSFEERFLCDYVAEGWLHGKRKGDLSVAPDATRVGHPAEETLVVPAWLHRSSVGIILAPQARLPHTIHHQCKTQFPNP